MEVSQFNREEFTLLHEEVKYLCGWYVHGRHGLVWGPGGGDIAMISCIIITRGALGAKSSLASSSVQCRQMASSS